MRRAFTLIEMTVVLLIVAIVTHLAMRQASAIRDQKLVSAASRQLAEIRESVYATGSDGEPMGFLADMGRMVAATNGTLSELWQQPAGVRAYAVLPAVKPYLAKDAPAGLAETNAHVATGWRGPYLRLPLGKRHLMDPWGNRMENPDDAGFNRIALTNGQAIAVTHFGPTALGNDPMRATCSLIPDGGAESRIVVKVVSRGGNDLGAVEYKWFGPKEGLITGGVTNQPYGVAAVFRGLTPGNRVVWDSVTGIARSVKVRPGDNYVQIETP